VIPFVDLQAQYYAIEDDVRAAVDLVLERGWYVLGEEVSRFEKEFAAYIGAAHAVAVGSGTDAVTLALEGAGIGHGDEVIVPANTCVPTAMGVARSGATPRFVDVALATYAIDVFRAEPAVTERTRAIVPVHLYGRPCDMAAVHAFAERHGLLVVEDCAQAHGADIDGVRCGTFGLAGAFSFYPTKNLGAYGDGGAITTNDEALAEELRMRRNYGFRQRDVSERVGINSRLDEVQAAVLRAKLKYLDGWNDARRERAMLYTQLLQSHVQTPHEEGGAWHLYVIRDPERDAVRAHLDEFGIGSQVHYPVPLHLQPVFQHLGYTRGDFPNAERACDEVLSLPLYPELSLDDVQRVAEAVRGFLS